MAIALHSCHKSRHNSHCKPRHLVSRRTAHYGKKNRPSFPISVTAQIKQQLNVGSSYVPTNLKTLVNLTNAPQLLQGLIAINKPRGVSSNDLSNFIRSKLSSIHPGLRFGFAGTLDENATGLFVGGVGAGTQFLRHVLPHDKTYIARIKLGIQTDSLDVLGNIVAESPLPDPNEFDFATVDRILQEKFTGEISQIPPAFSSLKIGTARASTLMRQGIQVEMQSRRVLIHSLKLLNYDTEYLDIAVHCGKGTYIRSLAIDIANALGTVGHLTQLHRASVGMFETDPQNPLVDDYQELLDRQRIYSGEDNITNHILDNQRLFGTYVHINDSLFDQNHLETVKNLYDRYNSDMAPISEGGNGGWSPTRRFKALNVEDLMNHNAGEIILKNLVPPHYAINYSQYFETYDEEYNPAAVVGQEAKHKVILPGGEEIACVSFATQTSKSKPIPGVKEDENQTIININGNTVNMVTYKYTVPSTSSPNALQPTEKQPISKRSKWSKLNYFKYNHIDRYLHDYYHANKYLSSFNIITNQLMEFQQHWLDQHQPPISSTQCSKELRRILLRTGFNRSPRTNFAEFVTTVEPMEDFSKNYKPNKAMHEDQNNKKKSSSLNEENEGESDEIPTNSFLDAHSPRLKATRLVLGAPIPHDLSSRAVRVVDQHEGKKKKEQSKTDRELDAEAHRVAHLDGLLRANASDRPYMFEFAKRLKRPLLWLLSESISPTTNNFVSPTVQDYIGQLERNERAMKKEMKENGAKQTITSSKDNSAHSVVIEKPNLKRFSPIYAHHRAIATSTPHKSFQSPLKLTRRSFSSTMRHDGTDYVMHHDPDSEVDSSSTETDRSAPTTSTPLSQCDMDFIFNQSLPPLQRNKHKHPDFEPKAHTSPEYSTLTGTPHSRLFHVVPLTPAQLEAHGRYRERFEQLRAERSTISAPGEYLELYDSVNRSRSHVLDVRKQYIRNWKRRVPIMYFDSRLMYLTRYTNEHKIKSSPILDNHREFVKRFCLWSRVSRDINGDLLNFTKNGTLINFINGEVNPVIIEQYPLLRAYYDANPRDLPLNFNTMFKYNRFTDTFETRDSKSLYISTISVTAGMSPHTNPKLNSVFNRDTYLTDDQLQLIEQYKYNSLGQKQYNKEVDNKKEIEAKLIQANETIYGPSNNSDSGSPKSTYHAPKRITTFHEKRMQMKRQKIEHGRLQRRLELETTLLEHLTQQYLHQRQKIYHQRQLLQGEIKTLQAHFDELRTNIDATKQQHDLQYENNTLKEKIQEREEQLLLLTKKLENQQSFMHNQTMQQNNRHVDEKGYRDIHKRHVFGAIPRSDIDSATDDFLYDMLFKDENQKLTRSYDPSRQATPYTSNHGNNNTDSNRFADDGESTDPFSSFGSLFSPQIVKPSKNKNNNRDPFFDEDDFSSQTRY